jgi:ribosome-associated protein
LTKKPPGPTKGTKTRTSARAGIPVRGTKGAPRKDAARAAGRSAAKAASRSAGGKSTAVKPGAGKGGRSGVTARGAAAEPTARAARDVAETRTLALAAMEAALDKKALMPVLIDVSAMASYTDFIGIVSGRSDRQVDAIADNINQLMKSHGRHVLGQEGGGSGRWTLLDFGEIVIHVFYHPVREFYDLESLWIDAPRVKMDIPPEAMLTQADALYGSF